MIFSGIIYSRDHIYRVNGFEIFLDGYAYDCVMGKIHKIDNSVKLDGYHFWTAREEIEVLTAFINYIWIDKQ